MKTLGNKWVVQGSPLASWLYMVYTLDVGRLADLMTDKKLLKTLTGSEDV